MSGLDGAHVFVFGLDGVHGLDGLDWTSWELWSEVQRKLDEGVLSLAPSGRTRDIGVQCAVSTEDVAVQCDADDGADCADDAGPDEEGRPSKARRGLPMNSAILAVAAASSA